MARSKKKQYLVRGARDLYHRHYCPSGHRVFPYDSLESLTVAPEPGARGGPVLLFSANSRRASADPDSVTRTAWCWTCERWVQTYRETRYDTMLRYLKRSGIQIRFNGRTLPAQRLGQGKFVDALDTRIEEKRPGTISR